MKTAFGGVDVVGKRKNLFRVGIIVLDGNFYLDIIFDAFHEYGLFVKGAVPAIEIFDKIDDAAFVVKFFFGITAFIFNNDFETLV